ncbi:MAG: radical SAM family heme chaperone HemW [Phycisphaerales bacterium]|nr:radical SAM family heme chaperone HemW [Planctomycetota bacterium]MCH8508746.1 radical SAM family heme chaperone HemW [Phycisphaerales bacterium]
MQRSIATAAVPAAALTPPIHAGDAPKPRSLYLHIPFCAHKCHYCDFYSIVDTRDRQDAFTARMVRELAALAPLAGPLDTIFVGGGTPSLLRPDLWEHLLTIFHQLFTLEPGAEFSVECNPETVTDDLMPVLAAGGVNRVSMGAQSFNRHHLTTLERRHDPDRLPLAADTVRRAGIERLSVDLISGVPGQTLDQWHADLTAALALGTEHLSAYTLTYEPGTAMTARLHKGEFTKTDDDLEADMYEHTVATLRARGLDRYEVSNHARPGAECRHNLAYWRQESWLAAGPSASAHVLGWRWKNTPRLDDYLAGDDDGFAPVCELEQPDPRRALMDRLMTGVRLREGVDAPRALADARPLHAEQALAEAAEACRREGWLTVTESRWTLTDPGFLFADRVAADLINAIP